MLAISEVNSWSGPGLSWSVCLSDMLVRCHRFTSVIYLKTHNERKWDHGYKLKRWKKLLFVPHDLKVMVWDPERSDQWDVLMLRHYKLISEQQWSDLINYDDLRSVSGCWSSVTRSRRFLFSCLSHCTLLKGADHYYYYYYYSLTLKRRYNY